MSIIRLEEVRREIGEVVILDSVSAALARGERVGLVGANGAGKTTLLEIIAGREAPDGGRVHVARGTSLGLLAQEAHLDPTIDPAASVRSVVRSGASVVESMEHALADLEARGAAAVQSAEYAALRERFEAADGYHLDQRVDETLAGLGIPRDRWGRRLAELSGGEQTRVALARLLVADPDLLMLDEPTNHLDITALEWLEMALVRRRGALLVASHDRSFLDAVVARIWELRDRRLAPFRGAYSAYLVQRAAEDERVRRAAAAGGLAIGREEELVQRYRSHRNYAKMHEHERRLEQLRDARVTARRTDARLALPGAGFGGAGPVRAGDIVVSLADAVVGFGPSPGTDRPVPVAGVAHVEVRRGERIGLVGPNGAGKTTLLRTLAGQLPALKGFVRIGKNVQLAYLSQLRDRALPGATVLDAMLAAAPLEAGAARSYLARFLFRGDDVAKPVRELSGGERSRLELAMLGIGGANLLLLDEPTNHLDIPAREALESFLRESNAALVVVSHDRRLLENVCERLWVVEPSRDGAPALVVPFDGGYRAWRAALVDGWTAATATLSASASSVTRAGPGAWAGLTPRPSAGTGSAAASPGAGPVSSPSPDGPARGAPEAASARTPAPGTAVGALPPLSKDVYRRERRRIEDDLARLGGRKEELEAALVDVGVRSNFVELRRLTTELADVDSAMSRAEDAWLALEERAPR